MLDRQHSSDSQKRGGDAGLGRRQGVDQNEIECLEIGLVNNMPDSAVDATERQFLRLIEAGAGRRKVRLRRFMLPETPRAESLRAAFATRYVSIERLDDFRLDALIVTGSEPRTPTLQEEPYWKRMTKLVDWAQENTISTLWSCLAAHAAVLHLDGVERRRLVEKRTGVFACEIASNHALARGASSPIHVPHSRLNELRERELVAGGYEMLTVSAEAGVDAFIKRDQSLFLFFQGHPEYEAHSLLQEYRRDLGRYLRGESACAPPVPHNYFEIKTQTTLETLTERSRAARRPDLLEGLLGVNFDCAPQIWGPWSTTVYRNWLSFIAQEKARRQVRAFARAAALP